ncbi:N-acetylmuramoyl-L-alanine amidase [Empedobacter falsenii]
MKKLTQILGVVAIGLVSFSFTTKNEVPVSTSYTINQDAPKVVILDIVDNIAEESGANIATELKSKIETLNKENVNVLLWKDLTKGLQEEEKRAIIDSLKPELIMTLSFDKSDDNTNKVAAVVSKQNVAFEDTFKVAKELAENLNSTTVKNDGVYQNDSNYIQDNLAPSIFLSLKVKNEPTSNTEIIDKISNFIETAEVNQPTVVVDEVAEVDTAIQ